MSNSKTYLDLLINSKSKSICRYACCGSSISSPCSLAALQIIPPLPSDKKFNFNSIEDAFLTKISGNNPPFIGADVASSILLNIEGNKKTYLWFFGDTLKGTIIDNQRIWEVPLDAPPYSPSTRNSIGIWSIYDNNILSSTLNHYIPTYNNQTGQNGLTYGFFSPIQTDLENDPQNYWPINAININNELYVICERVSALSLTTYGIDVLKLNVSSLEDPKNWTYEFMTTIPGITDTLTIGNAFTKNIDNFIYFYGSKNIPYYYGFVTKISTNNFINNNWINGLQVYNGSGWVLYYSYSIPKTIYSPLPLTSTITYHSFMSKWIMLTINFLIYGPKVGLFYSDNLEGNWNGPIFIYDIPNKYLINSNIVYYAPFFHNEFMENIYSQDIFWSYNINSFNVIDLQTNTFLYTPKIIRTTVNINYKDLCN